MASKTLVQVVDDLDGSELAADDVEEIRFGLDDRFFVIDLSKSHAQELRAVLRPYADVARRGQAASSGSRSSTRAGSGSKSRSDLAQVRQWAVENGWEVSARGRIPADVLTAYDAQH